jgi:hypothetical protein
MSKYLPILLALLLFPAAGLIRGGKPLRVEVDLADGSHLLGTPGITSVLLRTSYARLDLPLAQLGSLQLGADRETVACSLQNGDKLSGVLTLAPFRLQTLFGPVTIGPEQVRTLRVAGTNLWADEALIGYWRLDGDAANGKGGAPGRLVGARFTDGRPGNGQGVAIQGVTSYVNLGAVRETFRLGYNRSFTVSLWAKIKALRPGHVGFLFEAPGAPVGSCGDNPFGTGMMYDDKEGVLFAVGQGCVGDNHVARALELETWHHYVGVFDTREIRFYVDGAAVGATPYTFGAIPDTAADLVLGTMRDQGNWVYTDAVLDNFAIWSRALSPAEVMTVYRTSMGSSNDAR